MKRKFLMSCTLFTLALILITPVIVSCGPKSSSTTSSSTSTTITQASSTTSTSSSTTTSTSTTPSNTSNTSTTSTISTISTSSTSSTTTTKTSTSTTTTSTSTTTTTSTTSTVTTPTGAKPTLPEVTLHYPDIKRITADELEALIDNGPAPVIVDTRSASSYAKGHIEGAINIPSYPPGVSVQMALLGLPKDQLIVFYCD